MYCPNCKSEVSGGNFCESCGARLIGNETAASSEGAFVHQRSQPNKQLEIAKNVSQKYFGFFSKVIKSPYMEVQNVGIDHFVNGLISIILYALCVPLVLFIGVGDAREFIDNPFVNIVIKPTFAFAILIFLIASYSFISIKLGKVEATYKEVISRFGSSLIPFVGMFAMAVVFAILGIQFITALFLLIGFLSSIFIVPPLVVASFKGNSLQGLDALYGTLLIYLLTIITFFIMGEMLFSMIGSMIEDYLSSFTLF